jgi:hypothetical protein
MTFNTNEKEDEAIELFKKHIKKKYKGEGSFTYCFTPTGIANSCIVKHSSGEQLDVTDYDSW